MAWTRVRPSRAEAGKHVRRPRRAPHPQDGQPPPAPELAVARELAARRVEEAPEIDVVAARGQGGVHRGQVQPVRAAVHEDARAMDDGGQASPARDVPDGRPAVSVAAGHHAARATSVSRRRTECPGA